MNNESTSTNESTVVGYIDMTPTWGEWGNIYRRLAEGGAGAALPPLARDFAKAMAACEALQTLNKSDRPLTAEQNSMVRQAMVAEMSKQGFGPQDDTDGPTSEPAVTETKQALSPRDQMIRDTLVTCIEGGSTYWLAGQPKRLTDSGAKFVDNGEPWHYTGVVKCRDAENDDKFADISLATVELGFRRIVEGSTAVRADLVGTVTVAWLRPDDADIDAEAADAILQAGLFGELVYG